MQVIGASLVAFVATMIGGLIVVFRHAWAERHRHAVVAFAAGVLISLTFLEILPEAFENGYKGGVFAVLGFVGMYCLEHLFSAHRHVDEHCLEVRASRIAYVGLVIHSLVDGLALAAGFELNAGFGWLVAAGVVLHEVPEGLASGSLLICSGVKRAPTLLLIFLVAVVTPIGAAISAWMLAGMPPSSQHEVLRPLLAATAGTFVYVGAADLLPHSHREPAPSSIVAFFVGVAIMAVGSALR